MRLLNASTRKLEEFHDESGLPPYAILSHTWGKDEITYQDMLANPDVEQKEAYHKILKTCEKALKHGFAYAWIDACCIDKSSSAELSEAINSMYRWYGHAEICYAYLADVSGSSDEADDATISIAEDMTLDDYVEQDLQRLGQSRWFRRGWTLQELLSPYELLFYGEDWKLIATMHNSVSHISRITGIE